MSKKRMVLAAGLFGNALEWYDFILYANFAPIIATLFFPTNNPFSSLLLTLAVFAMGFLVRPLGAIFFGYIGDCYGRKNALIASISIITVPTLLLGLIPSYASIGIIAPILLTLLRLIQGIAISGELNSATTFLIEHTENKRGLTGSLVMCTAFIGILVGALLSFIMTFFLPNQFLYNWGWRIPFLISGFLGIFGLYLRIKVVESPKFLAVKSKNIHSPLKEIFSHFYKEIILTILLTSIMAVGNYIFIAYIVSYLVQYKNFTLYQAALVNFISMLCMVIFLPMAGLLSDKFGRKPVFKIGIIGIMVFAVPIFWLLSYGKFLYALAGNLLLAVTIVPIVALIPTLLAELFPTQVRNSGTTIGYNICLAIFGGTAPLISFELVHLTNNHYAPGFYLMGCALLSFMALYFISDQYQKNLK